LVNATEEDWDRMAAVHLGGARHLAASCLRSMLEARGGNLLFLSSVVATTGNIGQGAYSAMKAAVVGFSRCLAREYGPRNIRSNVVLPGFHPTRLAEGLSPEAVEAIRSRHLLPETASMEEVASFCRWLSGTRTISGQVFNLDSRLPGWL
jgi:3-oxoacyl-[acyl-carrier protein] reductase